MKTLLGLAMAAAVTVPVVAAPVAPPVAPPDHAGSGSIILVEGGCGPNGHRDYYGYCRPNYYRAWRPCPPGYHLGYDGRLCYIN
jgi:hypothetical protein